MSKPNSHFYEFGPFRVDTLKRTLLRDGEMTPITPKAFDILLTLIERNGEVLSKDDLMSAVWPGTVVEENNLTRNISTLRKALGEQPNEHQYVVTIPGRGYRFVAEVKELFDADSGLAVEQAGAARVVSEKETPIEFPSVRVKRGAIVALVALIVAGAGSAIWLRVRARQQSRADSTVAEPFRKMRPTRLTNTGNVWAAAIAPDGEYVSLVIDEGRRQSLW